MTLTGPDLRPGEWPPDWADEFTAICDSNRGRLVRWVTAIFGPRDAEDIAQEALARLYARPGLLDEDADPWPWLSVVARNVGRDMMRHAAYSTTVESRTLDMIPDEEHVPDRVVARDDAERLRVAMNSLSPRDRALIRLRDVEGVPVSEIAELLRLNDNAVRQQLFRARKRLANAFLDLGGDRRLGIFGVLGLRCRELARRYSRAADAVGPSATTMLASAAPAIAAIVSGALVAMSAPAPPRSGSAVEAAGGGATGVVPAGPGGVAVRPASAPRPRPTDPFFEYEKEVAGASVTAYTKDPLNRDPGERHRIRVEVDGIPVVGSVYVETWGYSSGGHGPVCRLLNCPTALPTPAVRR